MSKTPRGLGKGLNALLGDTDLSGIRKPVEYVNKSVVTADGRNEKEIGNSSADIRLIPVGMIEPNPFQPRSAFDPEKKSIMTKGDMNRIAM